MVDGYILKIKKLPYLQNCVANFHEILHDDKYSPYWTIMSVQKLKFLEIQDGRRPPF